MKRVKERIRAAERTLGRPLPNVRRMFNKRIKRGLKGGDIKLKRVTDHLRTLLGEKQWEPTFCEADYTSGDGFQTSVWGPCTWVMLHLFSLNYSPARKQGYKMLIEGLCQTLPCGHCRNNFDKNWKVATEAMKKRGVKDPWSSREHFSRLVWELHHAVNVMLGKDISREPTFEQMRDDYETFRSRCLTPEEIAEAQRKAKESGCLDSPYSATAKAQTRISFVPRGDLTTVSPIQIDPQCRVCPQTPK